jgi:aminotransferase
VARRAVPWLAGAGDAAQAAAPAPGLDPIDLRGDELDLSPAPHIVAATVAALARGETHYTARPGILPLRRAIAARTAARGGTAYNPDGEVLVAGGGREGLFVAVQILVERGDEVLVQDPGVPAIREAVRLAGGVPVPVTVTAADGWALRAGAVTARLGPRTRVLILASPDGATGGVTSRAELEALATLVHERDLLVIFDESYRPFVFDGAEAVDFAALPGMRERTVTVGSFSAEYGMAGWRAGYVTGAAAILRPITSLKSALTICSPAPSQWAALAALEGPQDRAVAARREVAARRAAVVPALAALGLPVAGTGSPFLFVDVRATRLGSRRFAAWAWHEAGVGLQPGEVFGAGGAGWVRLSLVRPAPVLLEAVARLGRLLGKYEVRSTKYE